MDAGDNEGYVKNFNVLTMMAPTMPSCSNTESDVSNQVDDNGGDDDVGHEDDDDGCDDDVGHEDDDDGGDDDVGHEDDDDGGDDDADHANRLRRLAWS